MILSIISFFALFFSHIHATSTTTSLIILNALPSQSNVDIYVGGSLLAKDLPFNSYATYFGDLSQGSVSVSAQVDGYYHVLAASTVTVPNTSYVIAALVQTGATTSGFVTATIPSTPPPDGEAIVLFFHLAFGVSGVDFVVGPKTVTHYVTFGTSAQATINTGSSAYLITTYGAVVNGYQSLTTEQQNLYSGSIELVTISGYPGALQISDIQIEPGSSPSPASRLICPHSIIFDYLLPYF